MVDVPLSQVLTLQASRATSRSYQPVGLVKILTVQLMRYLPNQLVKDVVHQHRPQTPKQFQAIVQYISLVFIFFSVFPPPILPWLRAQSPAILSALQGPRQGLFGGWKDLSPQETDVATEIWGIEDGRYLLGRSIDWWIDLYLCKSPHFETMQFHEQCKSTQISIVSWSINSCWLLVTYGW